MQNKFFKKGLAVGVICFLMLISIPMVTGTRIDYPKENGPYTVFIGGYGGLINGSIDIYRHPLPFWYLIYPEHITYNFKCFTIFFVNGERQELTYPAEISLRGFKGYAQPLTCYILILTLFRFIHRTRVLGRCDEIIVWDAQ